MDLLIYHNEAPKEIYQVIPDTIQNRFDLFANDYYVFVITSGGVKFTLTGCLKGMRLNLGLWLVPIPENAVRELFNCLFSQFKDIKQIRYQHSYSNIGKQTSLGNHFKILLPDNVEELQKRLSSKHRYNLRREQSLIEKEIGHVEYIEYHAEIPADIVEAFFRFKYATHSFDYHLTPQQYLEEYHVTDAYVMKADGKILSIVFSCEQCAVTYIENLTYDALYAKYSPGQVLYNHYLERLVERGRTTLFLSGGDMAYKKRYGSIEEVTYDGLAFRSTYWYLQYRLGLLLSTIRGRLNNIIIR